MREHGTRTKYVVEKCRCDACRKACRDYEQWRAKQQAMGRTAYVDAGPVRAHVRTLQQQGLGWKRIADRAGVPESTMWKLLYGDPARGSAPSKRVRRRTARAVLAVTCDLDALGAAVHVPAVGTVRRLQALVAIGWAQRRLARTLGRSEANFTKTMQAQQVRAATARGVRDLFARLWDTPPAETTWGERQSAARARNHARRCGWVVPMAWDDIDDPAETPDVGAPEAPRRGKQPKVDLDEVAHLRLCGLSDELIADRFGVQAATIRRAEYRALERAS